MSPAAFTRPREESKEPDALPVVCDAATGPRAGAGRSAEGRLQGSWTRGMRILPEGKRGHSGVTGGVRDGAGQLTGSYLQQLGLDARQSHAGHCEAAPQPGSRAGTDVTFPRAQCGPHGS